MKETKYINEVRAFSQYVRSEMLGMGNEKMSVLADEIGVPKQTLSNWLAGMVQLSTFKQRVQNGLASLKKKRIADRVSA